ncbi:MAG: hypothetical protein C0437_23750 [Ralstonia sp.]|nr:hypothetical protein [Ralstonia sp.]
MEVRHAVLIGFVAVGAVVGMVVTLVDGWGLRIVMMTIGAIAGAAIGGAVSRIVAGGRKPPNVEGDVAPGQDPTGDDLLENYWRDKGRPQLTSALEPEHGRHQFDPDKL